MRKLLKFLAVAVSVIIISCAISFFTDKSEYGEWKVQSKTKDSIAWLPFYWLGDTISGWYYDRAYMFVATHINGVPNPVSFQFDLGDPYTEVYRTSLSALASTYTALRQHIGRLRSPLQFWYNQHALKNLTLTFDNADLSAKNIRIKEAYGDSIVVTSGKDTIQLGTLGADVFYNRVLIIDYPHLRFAVCDSVPPSYTGAFVPMEFDPQRRKIVLPMTLKNKQYRITFDNGSSLFPLLVPAKNINKFSNSVNTDTLRISFWGQYHNVFGRMLNDSFILAGKKFGPVKVYANHSGLGIDPDTDGLTGNALFWNNVIIIDFKNKRFAIK